MHYVKEEIGDSKGKRGKSAEGIVPHTLTSSH